MWDKLRLSNFPTFLFAENNIKCTKNLIIVDLHKNNNCDKISVPEPDLLRCKRILTG